MKLFIIIICLAPTLVFSQNWTGNSNSDWNNPSNWSSWPLNGSNITINPALYTGAAAVPVISANSVFTPALVSVINGGNLTINANLTTQDDVEVLDPTSQLIVNGGTFSVNPGNGGRLIIDLGASMLLSNGNVIVDERFIAGEDAVVTINGGSASSGQRILMDLGGKFIQNGGSVSVAQTFAMADGNLNAPSSYELHNGSLNITGEMAFENEAGNFDPYFLMTGGTLTINGDMMWLGVAPGSGTPRFITTGGTVTANGLIHNSLGSTVNMYLEISGTATFNYSGSLIETQLIGDSIVQKGTANFTLTGTNNLINRGVFLAENDVITTFNGSTTLSGTGNYDLANVLINPTKIVTLARAIKVKNNFTNNGNFTPQTNDVAFTGSNEQFVNGTGTIQFYSVKMDHQSSQGVTLLQDATITSFLNLLSGKINTSTSNSLTLIDNASSTFGNSMSYVNGPLIKIGNDAFLFPIGKNNQFAAFEMNAPSTINNNVTAEYFGQSFSNVTAVQTPLSAVNLDGYWNMTKTIATDNLQIGLHWNDANQNGITDCAATSVANWDGSNWNNLLSSTTGACSGSGSGKSTTISSVSETGIFTFGFFGNVVTQQFETCFGDSIEVNGIYFNTDTLLIAVYTDILGNDSTVISDLNINPLQQSNQNFQLCAGETLSVGTNTYVSSGNYIDTLIAINGCDSIVTTTLFIQDTFDLSITPLYTNDSIVLTANQSIGSYQWINCTTNTLVANATNQSFNVTQNGNYACVLTNGNCSDTTSCILVSTIGIDDEQTLDYQVIPNPFENEFQLNFTSNSTPVKIVVKDVFGSIVFCQEQYQSGEKIQLVSLASGIYFIEASQSKTKVNQKVIKL